VVWSFKKEGSTDKQEITSGGVVQPSFSELFTTDQSNKSDLMATMTDDIELYCGEYECVDSDGDLATATVSSKFALIEMIVLFNMTFSSEFIWARYTGLYCCHSICPPVCLPSNIDWRTLSTVNCTMYF